MMRAPHPKTRTSRRTRKTEPPPPPAYEGILQGVGNGVALGKNGDLTGYHWGLTRKRAMLGWEAGKVGAA